MPTPIETLDEFPGYSLCEGVMATGRSPWHIRELTSKGRKLGGGIDTPTLCGRIKNGWDLQSPINQSVLQNADICVPCHTALLQRYQKEPDMKMVIRPDGTIEAIFTDDLKEFVKDVGGEVAQVCRASNVDWESTGDEAGWSVRAAWNPGVALREVGGKITVAIQAPIKIFATRAEALKEEVKHFWELLWPYRNH